MIRSLTVTTMFAVVLYAPGASHAALFGGHANSSASQKVRWVKITLRNRTDASMNLMIEDKLISIPANGEYELKAAEGTHVYGDNRTVKLLVTRDLNGTVCSFR